MSTKKDKKNKKKKKEESNSDSIKDEDTWYDEIEKQLKNLGEQAKGYAWMHGKCRSWFNFWATILSVPNGILAVALSISLFINDPGIWARYLMAILQLTSGALIFMSKYFEWEKRSALHGEAQSQFIIYADDIESELILPRKARVSARRFYQKMKDRRQSLITTIYPPIISYYIQKYKEKFKDKDLEKPIIADNITSIEVTSKTGQIGPGDPNRLIQKENSDPGIQFQVDRFYSDKP